MITSHGDEIRFIFHTTIKSTLAAVTAAAAAAAADDDDDNDDVSCDVQLFANTTRL